MCIRDRNRRGPVIYGAENRCYARGPPHIIRKFGCRRGGQVKAVSLPSRSAVWLGTKKLSRIMLIFGALLLAALIVGLTGYLLVEDVLANGKFPQGVRVVGVSVAGLSRTEALARVQHDLAGVASRPLTLKVDNEKFQISPAELGVMLD